jgi:hypothetical protein
MACGYTVVRCCANSVDLTITHLRRVFALLLCCNACIRACAYAQAGHSATALFVLSSGVLLRYTVKGALHLENHDGGPGESRFMFGQVTFNTMRTFENKYDL